MGCCSLKCYSRRVVWVFIHIAIVISIIIVLLSVVLCHSCDDILVDGNIKIILVGKEVNEQWFISVEYTLSVACIKCLDALDDPGWRWYL